MGVTPPLYPSPPLPRAMDPGFIVREMKFKEGQIDLSHGLVHRLFGPQTPCPPPLF